MSVALLRPYPRTRGRLAEGFPSPILMFEVYRSCDNAWLDVATVTPDDVSINRVASRVTRLRLEDSALEDEPVGIAAVTLPYAFGEVSSVGVGIGVAAWLSRGGLAFWDAWCIIISLRISLDRVSPG
jgi:hypothetical protein